MMEVVLDECLMTEQIRWKENEGLLTSFPTGIPLPRPAVRPMTLAMKALRVRYSFKTTPRRMVFSSGIPEPANTPLKMWNGTNLLGKSFQIKNKHNIMALHQGKVKKKAYQLPVVKPDGKRVMQTQQGSWDT